MRILLVSPFDFQARGGVNQHIQHLDKQFQRMGHDTRILGAAALLDAAKNGGDVQAASDAWYANADDIAEFLAAANPRSWPLDEMKAMMKEHLDLTLAEGVNRLNGAFAADIQNFDQIHTQILHMADMLSDGIIAQFPAKFAS